MKYLYKCLFMQINIIIAICAISIIICLLLFFSYKLLKVKEHIKIYYGSQNFGSINSTIMTLDKANNAFFAFTDNDIFAFQELLIPINRWNSTAKPGSLEIFNPISKNRFGWFAAVATAESEYNKDKYLKAYGLHINPNLNFNISRYKAIHLPDSQYKGGVVVNGTLFDHYEVAFVSIHLLWDKKLGYNNPKNTELIDEILKYITILKVDYFVLLGDFNIKFSIFKNDCIPKWKKIISKLNSEVDDIDSSLITCFDEDGLAHPDHILTNLKINSFRTCVKAHTDHCFVFGSLLFPIPWHKKLKKSKALNSIEFETKNT